MTDDRKPWIKRLNVLLRLAYVDPWVLTDGAWSKLLDDVCLAVYGVPAQEPLARAVYTSEEQINANAGPYTIDHAAARKAIRAAQEVIRRGATGIKFGDPREPAAKFHLKNQTVMLERTVEGRFALSFWSADFETSIYNALAHLIEIADITANDLLICNRDRCQNFFIPLRKPSNGMKSYCSVKCANVISARNYRKRKTDDLKIAESERNHGRYVKKVRRRFPNAPVTRRPKKK